MVPRCSVWDLGSAINGDSTKKSERSRRRQRRGEAEQGCVVARRASTAGPLPLPAPTSRKKQVETYMEGVLVVVALVGEQGGALCCWWGWDQAQR